LMPVTLLQVHRQMSFPNQTRRRSRFDPTGNKDWLRIAVPKWLQPFMPVEKIKIQMVECELSIEMQPRNQ
jgi:hypothetical protein